MNDKVENIAPAAEAESDTPDILQDHILVIKHGALGDMVMATAAFAAIRRHHANAHISILTSPAYADMAERMGWFDEVLVDAKPKIWQLGKMHKLGKQLTARPIIRVYDLQNSDRSNSYFRLMKRRLRGLEWCGIARGCSHPQPHAGRRDMHSLERLADQLTYAGITDTGTIDLSWCKDDSRHLCDAEKMALIVPGGSAHRPEKRWTINNYAELCVTLRSQGYKPVLIGGQDEIDVLREIHRKASGSLNLGGKTSFFDIISLAKRAKLAVGNDTGPMHLITGAGCPGLTLFSDASDPKRTRPRGPKTAFLQRHQLDALTVSEVQSSLMKLLSAH